MPYSLSTIWYERQRFLPGVLAVAFSALLIALQFGLLLGLFSITSIPIDESRADIWVGHPEVPSVDLGRPIPESWMAYLALPEVERTEPQKDGRDGARHPNEVLGIVGCTAREDRELDAEEARTDADEDAREWADGGHEQLGLRRRRTGADFVGCACDFNTLAEGFCNARP